MTGETVPRGHVDTGVCVLATLQRVALTGLGEPDASCLTRLAWRLIILIILIAGVRVDKNLDGSRRTASVPATVTAMVAVVRSPPVRQPSQASGDEVLPSVEKTFAEDHASRGNAHALEH